MAISVRKTSPPEDCFLKWDIVDEDQGLLGTLEMDSEHEVSLRDATGELLVQIGINIGLVDYTKDEK